MSEKLKLFISHEQIQQTVQALAARINKDYPPDAEIIVVVTLKGAILFAADLIRELKRPVQVDFVRLASYGAGTQSSGVVRILKDIEISPQGKHLLVLDEIVDTGRSIAFLTDRLKHVGANSVRFCTLLDKPSRRQVPVKVDYVGKEVEDKFLVGYGLDYNEHHRNLRDIFYIP